MILNIPDILIVSMVKDLEDTRDKYQGYSYVTTMRNILVGKPDAAIAPYFRGKIYHGIINKASKEDVEETMESMVNRGILCYVISETGKKLYCTNEHHDYLCSRK